jgi:NADH-quinone oxidoreductase subunit D
MEKMLKIQVPERVEYIRVIMAEFSRIISHLIAIGTYGLDIGAFTPFLYCMRDREHVLDIFEETCGARLLYNYMWIGGLSHDVRPTFQDKVRDFCTYFRPNIKELNDLLSYNKIFIDRTANVGVLPGEVAVNYGASGPVLRGSGVKWDLRKDDPYSIYNRFDFEIPFGKGEKGKVGDCWDRYMVRVHEMEQSVNIIEQAVRSCRKAMCIGDSKRIGRQVRSTYARKPRKGTWATHVPTAPRAHSASGASAVFHKPLGAARNITRRHDRRRRGDLGSIDIVLGEVMVTADRI